MFKVIRTTINSITNQDEIWNDYRFDNLSNAIDCMKKLEKQDRARYEALKAHHDGELFFDESSEYTGYHFSVGKCGIHCEIEGLYDDAYKTFLLERQNVSKKEGVK